MYFPETENLSLSRKQFEIKINPFSKDDVEILAIFIAFN